MDGYGYNMYPPGFQTMHPPDTKYRDQGDGYGEYYEMGPVTEDHGMRSRSRQRRKNRSRSRSNRSRSDNRSYRSRSKSRSRSRSRSREINYKEPGFLDAFRVLYLAPSKHRKNTTKFLATKKRQDHIENYLKSDGLGSKRWLFYPRTNRSDLGVDSAPSTSRNTCDQRVKVDGDFLRKYKRSKKVDSDAPIRKLKRWELVMYKKLGFIQAV